MTTNTLRPNATVSAGGASFTGGVGNWHGNTSDDSDASYATLSAGAAAVLDLGTFTLDTGNVTKQVRVRARCSTASSTATFAVNLTWGGLGLAFVSGTATTTPTTFTGTYFATGLRQEDIDALQLSVEAVSAACRFLELYVDVIEVGQPTVTILAPTGTVAVSSPTALWTYTAGSDGGAQTRYQIKVFTDAVFDGGGFDPDTSDDIYDSGEVASSSALTAFGPVVDGADHHAHVRVAQTVNGSQHWSEWDEQIFTIDTDGPGVTSISAVATSATGLVTVTVNRDTGGGAWDSVTVERSLDSGTTWEFVRGASAAAESNVFATFAANSFVVADYEVPNGTSVVYRARASLADEVGAWSSNSSPTSWSSTSTFLKSVSTPTLNVTVAVPGLPEYSVADTRTVNLDVQTATLNAAGALEDLLGPIRQVGVFHVLGASHPVTVSDAGSTLLLQFPSTVGIDDMYLTVTGYGRGFVASARSQKTANIVYRLFNVQAVEVDCPLDTTSVTLSDQAGGA